MLLGVACGRTVTGHIHFWQRQDSFGEYIVVPCNSKLVFGLVKLLLTCILQIHRLLLLTVVCLQLMLLLFRACDTSAARFARYRLFFFEDWIVRLLFWWLHNRWNVKFRFEVDLRFIVMTTFRRWRHLGTKRFWGVCWQFNFCLRNSDKNLVR